MSGDAPEQVGGIVRPSVPHPTCFETTFPSSPGMESTCPLPEQSQEGGGAIRRVSHLRPDSDEPEHVTGSDRKPITDPNYTVS